jgi:hypothetical protein
MPVQQRILRDVAGLPKILLEPLGDEIEDMDRFIQITNHYSEEQTRHCKQYIADIQDGLKHCSIHCVSSTSKFHILTGLSKNGFGILYASIRTALHCAYPNCPDELKPGEQSVYSENRFKLFLCLFRLRQGCSFSLMEQLFGWSTSALHDWFLTVIHILQNSLRNLHDGILDYLTPQWQIRQIASWCIKHGEDGMNDIQDWNDRVVYQNSEADIDRSYRPIEANSFTGSIGAVDGTYTIRCRVSKRRLERNEIILIIVVVVDDEDVLFALWVIIVFSPLNSSNMQLQMEYKLKDFPACIQDEVLGSV